MTDLNATIDRSIQISRNVGALLERRLGMARERYATQARAAAARCANATHSSALPPRAWKGSTYYWLDFAQRSILFWDTLRMRGNRWLEHERAGKPPVLHFDWELMVDGRRRPQPVNHSLVRIVPPEGVAIDPALRPFIIIDPRAGHGPGIGGFKEDSEVGVALKAGHPVYFVIFYPDPEPGQTLADVTEAEGEFVRFVAARHPDSPKPVLIGNCQGGWAVMMLAASQPDIAGPCVINGAPVSYWSGNDADSPMRYAGGLLGGTWLALLASDLGAGKFDGAHLVANFENLNPANTLWGKYYQLFADVDTEASRFLEFERWWGGYYLLNDEEIRWVVKNLFIGNKLSAGDARLGPGRYFDLRSIRSPIIVFASMGDNITPPQQAFNWIADLYSSTEEIKASGQTIVGLLHEDIGHLGIFVSGAVAKKEHTQIFELLKYIQQLPPGLYGMAIKDVYDDHGVPRYDVVIVERKIEDLKRMQKYDRVDEKPFEAVAALSELTERAYELLARPLVRQLVPEWSAKLMREFHPLRVERWALSDYNPLLWPVSQAATVARAFRVPQRDGGLLRCVETYASEMIRAGLDFYRDLRDATGEAAFFHVYGNMLSLNVAEQRRAIHRATTFDPRALPAVREVLDTADSGGAIDGFMRLGLLVVKASGGRRTLAGMDRMRALLAPEHLFDSLSEDELRRLLHEQSLIVEFEPQRAKRALPRLLRTQNDRIHAHALLEAMEQNSGFDDSQRALIAELKAMLPVSTPGPAALRDARASAKSARSRKRP